MTRRRTLLAAGSTLALPALPARASPIEVHGAAAVHAAPGLALAWALLRGRAVRDPGEALVVLSIELDTARHAELAVLRRDPFGSGQLQWQPRAGAKPSQTLRATRAQLAELPRTELRFYAAGAAEPQRIVWFAGVPDTTPEYLDAEALAAGVRERLQRARLAPR